IRPMIEAPPTLTPSFSTCTEVIAGMTLPMLIKLSSIRKGDNMAAALDEAQAAGRKYINVASQLLSSK
ncbi:hypothetical protein ENZ74_26040, partial [Mesorhizobium sp. M7A.F.Ca.CA.002.15.2.1]